MYSPTLLGTCGDNGVEEFVAGDIERCLFVVQLVDSVAVVVLVSIALGCLQIRILGENLGGSSANILVEDFELCVKIHLC